MDIKYHLVQLQSMEKDIDGGISWAFQGFDT